MNLAQVFGFKHVFALGLITLVIIIFLVWLQPKQSKLLQQQRLYIAVFAILFYAIELLRLIFLIRRDGGLAIYQLPLNLCSVPLYLYPLLVADKKIKGLKTWLMPPAFATVMLAGVIALIIPSNILGNEISWFPLENNLVEMASFLFHAIMVAAPLALIKIKFYSPKIKDIPYALAFTGVFAGIAMIVNYFTNQDFLLLNYGTGSPFQFLINQSKLLYQIVMIGLGATLISLFFIVGDALSRGKNKSSKL
jgi:hypothetical protein